MKWNGRGERRKGKERTEKTRQENQTNEKGNAIESERKGHEENPWPKNPNDIPDMCYDKTYNMYKKHKCVRKTSTN